MKSLFPLVVFKLFIFSSVIAQSINESPEELYKWGMPMEINGVEVFSTKPANGYLVLQSGERLEGLLKLKKSGDELTSIQLKSKKKKKFKPDEVARYGLQIKISDITENGQKTFKDDGKNFKEARIFFKDGREEAGYLAFQSNRKLFDDKPEGAKDFYVGFYFTQSKADFLNAYPYETIKKIVHGGQNYFPVQGGYVITDGDDNMGIALFQKGTLWLEDGQSLVGEIMQQKVPSQWYADTLHIKTSDGEKRIFGADNVERFTQVIDTKERVFKNIQNVFVELLVDGEQYALYRNPFPSENKLLNTLAKSATVLAADQVGTQQARRQFKNDVKDGKDIGDVADSYGKAKQKQLETLNQGVEMSQDISIKKKEYILNMKETGKKLTLDKNKYKRWLKQEASNCIGLTSKILKEYSSDFSKIVEVVQRMEACK